MTIEILKNGAVYVGGVLDRAATQKNREKSKPGLI